jgi:CheY-like chemotaxis protein
MLPQSRLRHTGAIQLHIVRPDGAFMNEIDRMNIVDQSWEIASAESRRSSLQHAVLVVRDPDGNSDYLESVCEFLDIEVQHAATGDDLRAMLDTLRPMAVIADLDGEVQDGFHVMKIAADYDPTVPILLLTSYDPALLGAIDAVQEVWGLTRVATAAATAGIGALVDFICHAARDAGRPRALRA